MSCKVAQTEILAGYLDHTSSFTKALFTVKAASGAVKDWHEGLCGSQRVSNRLQRAHVGTRLGARQRPALMMVFCTRFILLLTFAIAAYSE